MSKFKLVLSVIAGMAVVGGISVWLVAGDGSVDKGTVLRVGGRTVEDCGLKSCRRSGRVSAAKRQETREDVKKQLERELELDPSEEAQLSVEQKRLLEEIREALEKNDRVAIIRIVQKMQKSNEWPDGIPVTLRKTAIEALGWFGNNCVPEILGFFADSDEEVRQTAVDAYEQSLFEANGDLERSRLLIAAAKTVDDAEAMDMMMMALNEMRPSRQVETIKEIWKSGTAGAKEALVDNIEFVTGEEGIDTPEKLDKWYNDPSGDHQDQEDAEEFYGPQEEWEP